MIYTEKMKENLYGARLNSGETESQTSKKIGKCFFIVDKTVDAEFIHKKVRQLYLAGCRAFVFFGKETFAWHNESDTEIIDLYIDDKDIAVTYDFSDMEDFIDDIKEVLCENSSVPTINFLFYDNYELYKKIKGNL